MMAGARHDQHVQRRHFGFDGQGRGEWTDDAANPVVRDSLVPIVVEQTVCFPNLTSRCQDRGRADKTRRGENGVMISTRDCFGSASSFSDPCVAVPLARRRW